MDINGMDKNQMGELIESFLSNPEAIKLFEAEQNKLFGRETKSLDCALCFGSKLRAIKGSLEQLSILFMEKGLYEPTGQIKRMDAQTLVGFTRIVWKTRKRDFFFGARKGKIFFLDENKKPTLPSGCIDIKAALRAILQT